MDKQTLKQIILEKQQEIVNRPLFERRYDICEKMNYVFIGVRRAGKSYALYQRIQQMVADGHSAEEVLYIDFEDNRLDNFENDDFQRLLEAYSELFDHEPLLFLDEVQNVDGWEKFARRMADSKYSIYITGSNAKMLSSEFMTTLGGRFLEKDVYPFSFKEFMDYSGVPYGGHTLLTTKGRANMVKAYREYMAWGGLPESIGQQHKRDYVSSTYQRIYLGDIASRNRISNIAALRLLVKKIAESVGQPISYNRLANILSALSISTITRDTRSISMCLKTNGLYRSASLLPTKRPAGVKREHSANCPRCLNAKDGQSSPLTRSRQSRMSTAG